MHAIDSELLTTFEVGEELKVDHCTVHYWLHEGLIMADGARVSLQDLGAFRAGWAWRIPREALLEFLRRKNGREVVLPADRRRQQEEARAASARLDKRLGKPVPG